MLDFLASNWNGVLTVGSFALAAATATYQIRHYRDQRPDLNILEVMGHRFYQTDHGRTAYEVSLRVENTGRESTTITDATLTLKDSGEELRLEGSQAARHRLSDEQVPNVEVGASAVGQFRVPGKDVKRIGYRGEGEGWDYGNSAEATLRIRTTGGDECEHDLTFEIVE